MQHLTEEQLVLHHYRDADESAHLAICAECRNEYEALRAVLAVVSEMPVPDRGEQYGEEVWTRLRWRIGAPRRRGFGWRAGLATAATIAIAFLAGVLWHARRQTETPAQKVATAAPQPAGSRDRLLVVVVGDHLDDSERVLTELANADASHDLDVTTESKRAEELVASNRIYRQAAEQRGDQRLATLLSDLEPILVELSHADGKLSANEVASIQKRIESKGLLFKARVVSAQGPNSI